MRWTVHSEEPLYTDECPDNLTWHPEGAHSAA